MNQLSSGAHSIGGPSAWAHCSPLRTLLQKAESDWTRDREVILRMPESSTSCVRSVRF